MKGMRLWLARLLVLSAASLLALKAGDVALGWLTGTQQRHLLRLPAGASYRHRQAEFDYTFTANSLGLRGPERPFLKPAGTRRVVVLGDSFVAGYGVADDDVLTVRLEALLNDHSIPEAENRSASKPEVRSRSERTTPAPVEVINVGRSGTSTIRELDLYTMIGRRFQPDVVVLAYFLGNDLREVVEEHDHEELRRWRPQGAVRRAAYGLFPNLYFELALIKQAAAALAAAQPQTEDAVLARLRRECEQRGANYESAVAAYRRLPAEVRRLMVEGLLGDYPILRACHDPGCLLQALDPDDEFFQRAWPRTEQHLELLRAAVAADGARLVILIIPDAVQVYAEAQQRAQTIGYEVDPRLLSAPCRTQQALANWCLRSNVPCLDLTEGLRASPGPLYYLWDDHFNAAGHERTAELLAEFLRERIDP